MALAGSDVRALFLAALERPAAERPAYLDEACGGDADLRQRVVALLRAHDEPGAFLGEGKPDPNATATHAPPSPLVGTAIAGRYKLLEEIGDGGMGTVWMAEQREPVKRLVAVKLIKEGMNSKAVLARFEAERQALALMDHPNIAKVFDAGTTDGGHPFFVMELVKGLPLTEYCDARRLSVNDRLDLFVQICSAVQHAHQKAVIHRDLKPSNVLVTEHDGKPVPKVIDFGLAKALNASNMLTERTLHTAYGTVVGTPLYMAPEQVGINALDVDTRTDIYALGVILYELLTGSTPLEKGRFKEVAWEEVKRLIREEEPPRPSTRLSSAKTLPSLAASRQVDAAKLPGLMRGELDWIVMKALDKDRTRRYETATGLAKDVQRHLAGDAVEACPPTLGYRLRKAYRKNRAAVLTGTAFAAVLLVAAGVSLAFGVQAKRSERRAVDQEQLAAASAAEAIDSRTAALRERDEVVASRERLARLDYARSIQLAHHSYLNNDVGQAERLLNATRPEFRDWEWHYLHRLCHPELFTLDVKHKLGWHTVAFSRDGSLILTAKAEAVIWNARTGTRVRTIPSPGHISCAAFNPDATRVVLSRNVRQQRQVGQPPQWLRETVVYDVRTGEQVGPPMTGHTGIVNSAEYSPDGSRILTAGREGTARVWDAATGKELHTLDIDQLGATAEFSPDGSRVVTTGAKLDAHDKCRVKLWDVASGRLEREWEVAGTRVGSRWTGGDGVRLILTDDVGKVTVWDSKAGTTPLAFDVPSTWFTFAAYSPDGKFIVTNTTDGIATVRDATTGAVVKTLKGHADAVHRAVFSPDGRFILTSSSDGTAKLWDATARYEPVLIPPKNKELYHHRFLPNDRGMMTVSRLGRVTYLDESGAVVREFHLSDREFDVVSTAANGSRIVSITSQLKADRTWDATVKVWDAGTGGRLTEFVPDINGTLGSVVISPDGRHVVTANAGTAMTLRDAATGAAVRTFGPNSLVEQVSGFSPDGKRVVAFAGNPLSAQVWDVETGASVSFPGHAIDLRQIPYYTVGAAFSPDGTKVFSTAGGQTFVWDSATGKELLSLNRNSDGPAVAFSPNGKRLLTSDRSGVTVWDAETGHQLLTLKSAAGFSTIEFSPDGTRFPVSTKDGLLILDSRPWLHKAGLKP